MEENFNLLIDGKPLEKLAIRLSKSQYDKAVDVFLVACKRAVEEEFGPQGVEFRDDLRQMGIRLKAYWASVHN